MIFVPFTGKDNHGKIIKFGAALLSGEDTMTYEWVLQKFKDCMGRSPGLIITNQDPALKIALQRVFPESNHCLCMWHIMMKVPEKVLFHLKKDEDFRKRLNAIVWSDLITGSEFEEQWKEIIVDFGLSEDGWFSSLYDIRGNWIPAYLRDIPMSGVYRTTSISESVNSFLSNYLNHRANLVNFFMLFESAMDAQRQSNDLLNSVDSSSVPLLRTPLQFEKHAASNYTTKQFIKVQEQIMESLFLCRIAKENETDIVSVYYVDDGSSAHLTVEHNKTDDSMVCSCNMFVRDGMLCCHIFLIFKHLKWDRIPEKYIAHRWTKAAYTRTINIIGEPAVNACVDVDENRRMINNLISEFYACIGAIDGDKVKMQKLMNGLIDLKDFLIKGDGESSSTPRKSSLFDLFFGISKPDKVDVLPPIEGKTKGSGSRLKSRKEAAIVRAKKPLRMCRKCNTLAHHDSRNCTA